MTTSVIDADSLLAIDVGTVNTRAMYFDVVDGSYRFLACGTSPTTAGAPFRDIGEGVRRAIDQLQFITGLTLVGPDERLILPRQGNNQGVDACVATLSAGEPLKVVVVGLLDDVSAASAERLARATYTQIVDRLSLSDRRKPDARIDSIVRLRPDVILVAGGTEGGASQSVMNILEAVGLACYLLPANQRPELLFAGNQALLPEVENSLGSLIHLTAAPNIRPSLEVEQISSAQIQLTNLFRAAKAKQIPGVSELDLWTGNRLMPTASAFGRVVRLISASVTALYGPGKGVLGVDVGASAAVLAAAFGEDLTQGVYPDLGLGPGVPGILKEGGLAGITRWLPYDIREADLLDYLHNKTLHPAVLPTTLEDLALEQALVRQALQLGMARLSPSFPTTVRRSGGMPGFDPIVAAGSPLVQAPTWVQSMLMLLDGLQPTDIATILVDQNNVTAALGAAASVNPVLSVQLLEMEKGNLLSLAVVISPVGTARYGAPCVRIKVKYHNGNENSIDVKFGSLEVIPLPYGQAADLHLQPLGRFDVGSGNLGQACDRKNVTGGVLGLIIDARGRPLRLPADTAKRAELMNKWLWNLGT